jgi:hypothetical protein
MEWLKEFFQAAFAAVGPLGLAAFAMLVVVALVAILIPFSGSQWLIGIIGVIALIAIVGMVTVSQVFPMPRPPEPAPGPTPGPTSGARWFDTGVQADWAGNDKFYGAGETPVYQANGTKFCNDDLIGRVATCWSSRPADNTSMGANVSRNVAIGSSQWCAYKDSNVTLATKPNGSAKPGRVYVCAHYIAP